MAATIPMNDENINISPRGKATRSRQHSTNSFLSRTFDSPVKRITHQSDASKKSSSPTKAGSPRGGASVGGAPDHYIHAHISRSSPLAPIGTNARASTKQSIDASHPAISASPFSALSGAGSKTDGLRLHWDDAHGVRTYPTKSLQLDPTNFNDEQSSDSHHQFASLSAQDLSIPDLRDSDVSPLDSHFLLSPFTMSEPNFSKSPLAEDVLDKAHSSTALVDESNNSPAARAEITPTSSAATPSSPPRQGFFQAGSTGSFSRFPTPDKLALGFTPSPSHLPSGLLLPPISPSGPMLSENNTLLRSESSQTLQSESSSSSSLNTSDSTSGLSEIAHFGASDANATKASSRQPSVSRSARKGGLSRSDIRESLLSFPSPPTSPRPFTFGRAADTLAHTNNGSAGRSRTRASTAEGYGTDELQASIDELLSAAGIGSSAASPARPSGAIAPPMARAASLPPVVGGNDSKKFSRSQPSTSLPPNMALPPLPPISKISLGQGDSPSIETPKLEGPPTATYSRPVLPLRAAHPSSPQLDATLPGLPQGSPKASNGPVPAPNRVLRSAKSTESFLAAKSRPAMSTDRPAMPKVDSVASFDAPKQARRRRASLSIKIPKLFAKVRKQEDDFRPQSAVSQDSLQLPQSRFSPDSDGPTPISEKAPANLFKRLSRAASSPNLKASAMQAAPRQTPRKDHFVAPASAPPVPTSFPAPLQADTSSNTPLPTPSLLTDIDSSMGGDSPQMRGSGEHEYTFARMQSHNPYFPKFPPRQSSLILSPIGGLQDARSPASPHDMDWLNAPPSSQLPKNAPLKVTNKQNLPLVMASDSCYSDSGSASLPADESKRTPPDSLARPSGTRRSTLSGSSNDDEEDDEEDAYGGKSASSDDYYSSSEEEDEDEEGESESDEDDVPLAQAHPDALKVQSSLRAKVKEQQTKKKKRVTKQMNVQDGTQKIRPKQAKDVLPPAGTAQPQQRARQPSREQSIRVAPPATAATAVKRNPFGFAPDELSEKLRKLDASHGRLNSLRMPPKRPDSAGERPHDLLLPQTDEHVKHRSNAKGRANLAPPLAPFVQDSVLTMSEGSDNEETAPLRITKKTQPFARPAAAAPVPSGQPLARQPTSVASSSPASPRSPLLPQHEHSFSALHAEAVHHSHMPPHQQQHARPTFLSKQRVYINDPQHHLSVDIDENMTAANLLSHLRSKNAISPNSAWTVTEVWRVMGVERPLREYELLQESIESWASEPNSSLLLVKKSPLAPLLSSLSKNRSDTETTGGWVQLEVKRGKWSKRYIEVRGDAMYIGKSEKQRDHTLLCHFSNFDAYIVPQACIAKMKTPKPFAFAVKSVDKVSLFENADQDYIHFFCVKTEAERDMWIQHILESRSKLVKHVMSARAAAHAMEPRTNLVGQQMMHHQPPPLVQQQHKPSQHHGMPINTASSVSRSASSKSHTPPMPSQAVFGEQLARRPSNAHPMTDAKKIISADNLPPLPGAIPNGHFATIPQGRDWERLGSEDKRALIHEASRKARTEGKALLEFGDAPEGAGLLGRSRAKSIGQRR